MATISYVVNAVDSASATFQRIAGSADELLAQLDELSHTTAEARVGLEGDKEAQLALDDIDLKLARLAKRVANPNVRVDGLASSRLGLDRLSLQLDRLNHKHVTVDVDVNRRSLGGLLSSLSGGGTPGLLGLLGAPAAIVGAGLAPGAIGLGLGGLAGLGAFGGGLFGAAQGKKQLAADLANIKTITTALKTAVGQRKDTLHKALTDANKQFAKDTRFFQPFTDFAGALKNLTRTVIAPLRPIMEPLTKIIQNFGAVLKTLGPQLTGLFQASLPFLRQFAKLMLTSGDILIPAFTQALQEMVKSGALKIMTDSLVVLVRGLGKFIVALGPGMKASAEMFSRLMTFLARALPVVGKIFSDVANFIMSDWSPAHLWNKLLASAKAFWRAVVDSFHAFWHTLAASFAAFRHDIASIWDTIWRNTVGRAQNGIHDLERWFSSLPGSVRRILSGFGNMLKGIATGSMHDFLSGLKSVGGTVLGWLKNFIASIPHFIMSLLHMSPPHPGSVFFDLGANLMRHFEVGIKSRVRQARAAWGGAIDFSGLTGPLGGDPARNVAIARRMFPWPAAMWPAFFNLGMRESGFNRFATNPTSGAYGIAQALPPTKMPFAAQAAGGSHAGAQLAWMFGYIAQRYGNPVNAWAHEVSAGWYDRGGWLPPGLSLALNTTGRPERVGGGGITYNIHVGVIPGGEREAGRRIVEAIKRYEQGAGSRWRQ